MSVSTGWRVPPSRSPRRLEPGLPCSDCTPPGRGSTDESAVQPVDRPGACALSAGPWKGPAPQHPGPPEQGRARSPEPLGTEGEHHRASPPTQATPARRRPAAGHNSLAAPERECDRVCNCRPRVGRRYQADYPHQYAGYRVGGMIASARLENEGRREVRHERAVEDDRRHLSPTRFDCAARQGSCRKCAQRRRQPLQPDRRKG